MLQPAYLPMRADRNVIFRRNLLFCGFNFTGATFKAAVKVTADASGSPLVALTTQTTDVQGVRLIYGGSATIAAHLAAGRLSSNQVSSLKARTNPTTGAKYADADTLLLSIVQLRIDKTTMQNASVFPFPSERGEALDYAWDILIAPSGGDEDKYAGGPFVVEAGVQT